MLYREPKVLKDRRAVKADLDKFVSVLYREPKVLKGAYRIRVPSSEREFQCSTVSRKY